MRTMEVRRLGISFLLGASLAAGACSGKIGKPQNDPAPGTGSPGDPPAVGGGGPSNVNPGGVTVTPTPLDPNVAFTSVRKVKNLLTGLAPTDADVALVSAQGPAGLQMLISAWMTDQSYQSYFSGKIVPFFRNMFQQTGFTPTEDFKIQLLTNGGFDFGPFGTRAVGDDIFPRLVQNLQDSFAMTAWQLVKEGRPFTETLTTRRFVMTTALKSLYIQVEMPADAPFGNQNATPVWTVDYSGNPIPLETALTNMVFSDEAPLNGGSINFAGASAMACREAGAATGEYRGTSLLFQRLLGFTPRFPFSGNPTCFEHPSRPYFTLDDVSRWEWVTITPKANPADRTPVIQPYNLPALRTATELVLSLPRIGFYTTPAFLALWNTNDSNQHRVTANQALLVALGRAFSAENTTIPFSDTGLDAEHSVAGSECVGCHLALDPMRKFWENQLDYNDRNDFPSRASFNGAAANPRPPAPYVNEFAFGDVRATAQSLDELGPLLMQVTDTSAQPLPRFGIAVAQQLCFWANSAPCSETDGELRRVVAAFRDSSFNFAVLMKELFSSPLVTGSATTGSYGQGAVPISIARRDHLCAALSNRLGKPDLCAQAAAMPSTTQRATATIAASIPSDGFSRGAESPVTPADPTLFFRAASEMLCEDVAAQVVDPTSGTAVYSSTDVPGAIRSMVETVMGYPASHPLHTQAIQILQAHHDEVLAQSPTGGGRPGGGQSTSRATLALRSTFALACEAPTAVGIGL